MLDHFLHPLDRRPFTNVGSDIGDPRVELSLSEPDVDVGVVQTGDDGLAFQVGDKGRRADVGLCSGITPDIDESAVLDRDGGRRAERFVHGVNVSVDKHPVRLLGVTHSWRPEGEHHEYPHERP